jgi:hypothetical protein
VRVGRIGWVILCIGQEGPSWGSLSLTGAAFSVPQIRLPPWVCSQLETGRSIQLTHLDPHRAGSRPSTEEFGTLSAREELSDGQQRLGAHGAQ